MWGKWGVTLVVATIASWAGTTVGRPNVQTLNDQQIAGIVVGASTPTAGCCIREHRPGCAHRAKFKCRDLTAGVPAECAAATAWTWLWCEQAYCDVPDKDKTDQLCNLQNSDVPATNKKRCANGCRAKGTKVATGCTAPQERCEYDMYTWNDKICPGGDCTTTTPGTVAADDHCAVIRICLTGVVDGKTLVMCDAKRFKGAACN